MSNLPEIRRCISPYRNVNFAVELEVRILPSRLYSKTVKPDRVSVLGIQHFYFI